MTEGVVGVTGEFLTSMWDALGGDSQWLEQVEIQGRGAMPSCVPMTDLGTASFASTGVAIAELLSTAGWQAPPVEVDRASCYGTITWLRRRTGGGHCVPSEH